MRQPLFFVQTPTYSQEITASCLLWQNIFDKLVESEKAFSIVLLSQAISLDMILTIAKPIPGSYLFKVLVKCGSEVPASYQWFYDIGFQID